MKTFKQILTATVNIKGVLDVDTVKGCRMGVCSGGKNGCYGLCYAASIARAMGFDFSISVSRKIDWRTKHSIEQTVSSHSLSWFRVGTMGDPSHNWELTIDVCGWLSTYRTPIVITKHWYPLTNEMIAMFSEFGTVFNTSISALDSETEIEHRINQHERLKNGGANSLLRVVTARFGNTPQGRELADKQKYLLSLGKFIDNPLRINKHDKRVVSGLILVDQRTDIGSVRSISLSNSSAYIGHCRTCPDQCGAFMSNKRKETMKQQDMFAGDVKFEYVESVLGSGYEKDVALLAIEDGIAKRAARKNMQIHSAIILKVNGVFAGFFTFQVNHDCKEFCFLQSVIKPEFYTKDLYQSMVEAVITKNTFGYPSLITTDPKSKFETPALFESLGFVTYLKMSGFCYMVRGNMADIRMKILAHITMTNVWNSVKGDWLNLKRAWNKMIDEAGNTEGVLNPTYATRDGCWQGENGYSQVVNAERKIVDGEIVVETKSHNGNASVLDPVACEVIARFFMPKEGCRVYNPFGGGVQFGFVSGACGYEYEATEIRKNQCDANNKICSKFPLVKWVNADSSTYEPANGIDLVFACPPYYKVEEYLDYDGKSPEGELNSLPTYEEFRELLFSGYKKAIAAMNDNRFMVIMTGDSRNKHGGYYCHEAETVCFFKEHGLHVYNQIVYLECEFTRLAHAKTTLNYRKFPKREQKIIVAYKGDIKMIKELFPGVGRL